MSLKTDRRKRRERRKRRKRNDEMEGEKDEQDAVHECGPTSGPLMLPPVTPSDVDSFATYLKTDTDGSSLMV